LLQLQEFFKDIGSIGKSGNKAYYSVLSVEDLTNIIIPHFGNYFLLTQKKSRFYVIKKNSITY
jgi:hypothetical protein